MQKLVQSSSIYLISPHTAHLDIARCHALKSHDVVKLHSLTPLKELTLSGCKQVNEMVLQKLFDGLHCLESLNLGYCNDLREIPNNISSLSLLKSLYLEGSSLEILPHSIKHLSKLQGLWLNCTKIKSLPELPLSMKLLYAHECPSLKTVSPLPNGILEEPAYNREMDRMDFAFHRSGVLDEKSLCNLVEFTHLSMVRAIYSNPYYMHNVSHVGSRIPNWFTYRGTSWVPFSIALSSNCGELLGFLVCGILPHFEGNCRMQFVFIYEVREDGYGRYGYSDRQRETLASSNYTDMWFFPVKGLEREYDEIVCYFECEARSKPVEGAECRVWPIYASQYESTVAKISES